MAKRRRYADSEYDELQLLKRENKELKREVQKLRKQISRFDLDRFSSFKEALDHIDELEMEQAAKRRNLKVEANKWSCWTCKTGSLKLTVIERRDGVHYFRKCDNCSRRTKLQKYTSDVKP